MGWLSGRERHWDPAFHGGLIFRGADTPLHPMAFLGRLVHFLTTPIPVLAFPIFVSNMSIEVKFFI